MGQNAEMCDIWYDIERKNGIEVMQFKNSEHLWGKLI